LTAAHISGGPPVSLQEHGSSPRAWGTLTLPRRFRTVQARGTLDGDPVGNGAIRFIPASLGERGSAVTANAWYAGSSPRAWGTHFVARTFACFRRFIPPAGGTSICRPGITTRARFIPAGAGNACYDRGRRSQRPVHPRGRGERYLFVKIYTHWYGSSPRARGTQPTRFCSSKYSWFIPACAGNAVAGPRLDRSRPVHPRIRGERVHLAPSGMNSFGSSPRAQGKSICGPGITTTTRARFIPACAGTRHLHSLS
jgi:hypothetical protein